MRVASPRFRFLVLSGVVVLATAMAVRDQGADGAAGAAGPAQVGDVVVPFELVQGLVVIQGSLGSVDSLNLILDSGVNPSVIGLAAAKERKLEITPGDPLAVQGVGGSRQLAYGAVVEDLSIANVRMPPFDAVVMELGGMDAALGRRLDGALGYSFLMSRALRIDYEAGEVTLFDGTAQSGSSGPPLPMVVSGGTVFVDSVFVGGHPVRAHLDTGAGPALTISEDAVDRLGLRELRSRAVEGTVRGARGTAPVWRVTADSVRVGDVSVRDVPVGFAEFVPEGDAILGSGFFSGMVLTLDYVAGTVHVREGAGPAEPGS